MTRLILLAAGASRRFGEQKLLASFEGKPLWRYAFEAAAQAAVPVTVVTRRGLLEEEGTAFSFQTVLVPEGQGMGASVAAGAGSALSGENLCFFVCDQPHLPGWGLRTFIQEFEASGRPLGRACAAGRYGSPAIFSAAFRPALMALKGEEGGRSLFAGREGETWCQEVPSLWLRDYDVPW